MNTSNDQPQRYEANGRWVPFPLAMMDLYRAGRLPKSALWTLLAMAEASQDGECRSSHARIAHFAGTSIRRVKEDQAALETAGLITIKENYPKRPIVWDLPWIDQYLPNWGRKHSPTRAMSDSPTRAMQHSPNRQKHSPNLQKHSPSRATIRDSLRESLEDDSRGESSLRRETTPPSSSSSRSVERSAPPPPSESSRKENKSETPPYCVYPPPAKVLYPPGRGRMVQSQYR